jgi:hypothetical protein
MNMKIVTVMCLCMGAWLSAGNAHAASSRLYPATGCQASFPGQDALLNRNNGFLESEDELWISCPIVSDLNSTRITVTVSYEAFLIASPTYSGKPLFFSCDLQGFNSGAHKSVTLNIRNRQVLDGSLQLSMPANPKFNVLACYLLGTQHGFYFDIFGYQVDES